MTVDFRATIATDLGVCLSGDIGSNHISDGSGLVMTQGRLLMDGIVNPARGTAVNLIVVRPQINRITRFPKPMFVIRAVPNPIDRVSEVEIGCKLTLLKDLKRKDRYWAYYDQPAEWITFPPNISGGITVRAPWAIPAQKVLEFCLQRLGITLSESSTQLSHRFLRASIDLSDGYISVIGDLIRSETKYGRILPNGELEVRNLNFKLGRRGPVLTLDNLYSIEAITSGEQPPDEFTVSYSAAEADPSPPPRLTSQGWTPRYGASYVTPGAAT